MLDTRQLGRRTGAMVEITREVPAPQEWGTAVIAVAPGEPIELEIRLESVLEGVLVSGSASTVATGACVRCLDRVRVEVDAPLQELFSYADRAAHFHEVGADDEEQYVLRGDMLDLEPVLHDAVVLALPFQPVCRADCPGLCSECGARLADDPVHAHDSIDPRWAALQALAPAADSPTRTNEKRN